MPETRCRQKEAQVKKSTSLSIRGNDKICDMTNRTTYGYSESYKQYMTILLSSGCSLNQCVVWDTNTAHVLVLDNENCLLACVEFAVYLLAMRLVEYCRSLFTARANCGRPEHDEQT